MPFGLRTRVGPENHALDWGPESRSPMGMGNIEGKGRTIVKYRHSAVTCAKTAEPIVMPFGLWARQTGPRNHELDGVQIPHEKAILGERVAHCKV